MLSERYLVRNKARHLKQNKEANMVSERYLVRNNARLLKQNEKTYFQNVIWPENKAWCQTK